MLPLWLKTGLIISVMKWHPRKIHCVSHRYIKSGNAWYTVWITYQNSVYGITPIWFLSKNPLSKNPTKEALGLPWNIWVALLYISRFSKWYGDYIPQDNTHNVNIHLLLNRHSEEINIFRINFQDTIRSFHQKFQVWKAKLQIFLETSKVGFIICSAKNLQFSLLIKKFLHAIGEENGIFIDISIQSELYLQMNYERKMFYNGCLYGLTWGANQYL